MLAYAQRLGQSMRIRRVSGCRFLFIKKMDFYHLQAGQASDGPVFSLARKKMGEKRVLGRGWCVLRVQFRQALII